MRLASYNVENLFQRPKALNGETWSEGKEVLKQHADLNAILGKATYSTTDKTNIITLMKALGLEKSDDGKFVVVRQNHGHLVKRGKKGLEVVADGRSDWIGWLDLEVEEVNEVATQNTARVIGDVAPDVLGIIEAENRPALVRFSKNILQPIGGEGFGHIMLIDGNDERGIVQPQPADCSLGVDHGRRRTQIQSELDRRIGARRANCRQRRASERRDRHDLL
ncbi:MAG: hypothetical protein HXY22_00605 [Alphaproteobacteria bacterium]|nr:hypothetical protein [Alphaproteobacteria bacterium]